MNDGWNWGGLAGTGRFPLADAQAVGRARGNRGVARRSVATTFHPEFKSRPLKPHPLFRDSIKAALKKQS